MVVTKSSVMLRVQRAEAGGLHGQRHEQSVRVLQQWKGVQQGQVKGCEVRPLPPLAKPSFWYAFAHAWPTGFILAWPLQRDGSRACGMYLT